jgi:hypothetical protein
MVGGSYEIKRTQDEAWIRLLRKGVRVIIIRAGTFVDILKDVEDCYGEQARAMFYDAGVRAGRKSTSVLLEEWEERGMDFLKRLKGFYSSEGVGWFKIREIDVNPQKQRGYIRIEQSFIAEEYGSSDKPVCDFLSGYFVGIMEKVFGGQFSCNETKCIAKGDPYCEFIIERT